MRSPNPDELLSALRSLQRATDPYDRRHGSDWQVIDAFMRASVPIRSERDQDAHQEALFAIARNVGNFDDFHPLAAAKWVIVIRRRRAIDLIRQNARDPVARGLSRLTDPEMDEPLTQISDAQLPDVAGDALDAIACSLQDAVEGHLQASSMSAASRHMARQQARASIERILLGEELNTIIERLGGDERLSADRVYKWVERGRPTVLAAIDRWAVDRDESIVAALRELFEKRRADAGQPRPSRRKNAE